jgi:hypothetical protein
LAEKTSLFELARILATPGQHKLRFKRDPERAERETTIILKDLDHNTKQPQAERRRKDSAARNASTVAAKSKGARGCSSSQRVAVASGDALARFKVATRGDWVTLPVTVAGRTYPFLLGTEFAEWRFDESLRDLLGAFSDRVLSGEELIERYQMPPLRVGPLQVPAGKALCGHDLHLGYELGGRSVYGIIPAGYLRDKICRVDFDRGELEFLRTVPRDAGDRFDLVWRDGIPRLLLDLPDAGKEEFLISSERGFTSGSLRSELFDRLVASGRMKPLGTVEDSDYSLPEMLMGVSAPPQATMDVFRVGRFRHEAAIFAASEHSQLDMGYLSHYVATFDLAHSAMYLKPGKEYSRPDLYDAVAGLWITPLYGQVSVSSVKDSGPAQQSGLESSDEIVTVDGVRAEKAPPFEIARLLSTPGEHKLRFRCEPERADRETTMVLMDPRGQARKHAAEERNE